jgi:AraC-like DNA-binding protein
MARVDQHQIVSQCVPLFLRLAREAGAELAPLLRQFKLPEKSAELPEVALPLHQLYALCEACAVATGNPSFGLSASAALDRGAYGLLEFTARSAPTIREAFSRLVRHSGLLNELVLITLEERGGVASFNHRIPGEPLCVGRHCNEYTLATIVGLARELSGKAWSPRRVWFANPAPAELSGLKQHFRCPLEFDAGANGFSFDASFLDQPIPGADAALLALLDRQSVLELARRPKSPELLERVRAQIRLALRDGASNVERVAAALHMSSRTLQRRLGEHRTSFHDLLEDVRRELARAYVENPKLPLGEVAFLLGYSEMRAFLRAYKRWTGKTPGQHRAG